MIRITGAKLKEKILIGRVEKALYARFFQKDIFVVDVAIVDEETIRLYNRKTRNKDEVTDVLSFPYLDTSTALVFPAKIEDFGPADLDDERVMLGSIMICRSRAEKQANDYGHSYAREISFLVCHGLLHLIGLDHMTPDDEEIMTAFQNSLMETVKQHR